MNTKVLVLAFAVLVAVCLAQNQYGWPDAYERYLARQGIYDLERHEVRREYRNRERYERDLLDLYEDWRRQTRYGYDDFDENRFGEPVGGYGRYGFNG